MRHCDADLIMDAKGCGYYPLLVPEENFVTSMIWYVSCCVPKCCDSVCIQQDVKPRRREQRGRPAGPAAVWSIVLGWGSTLPISKMATTTAVQLTLLKSPLARCLDGSPGGFYLARNSSSRSWIIELQGGGECTSKDSCGEKLKSSLGSSAYFARNITPGFLSADSKANPRFRTFNRVLMAYCSQDLWTGRQKNATADTFGVLFAGHHILKAALDVLDAEHGLYDASDVVLTGESAGAMGVWPHLNWLAQRYFKASVVGVVIAGFYFYAYPYTGPGHTSSHLADFSEQAWPAHAKLWDSFVDFECAASLGAWPCMLANNSAPYVRPRVFIVQAQSDRIVLTDHDWVPRRRVSRLDNLSKPVLAYLQAWRRNLSVALAPSMRRDSPNGVFSAACFIHTEFLPSAPRIRGHTYLDSVQSWYFGDTRTPSKLQDDCGVLCNPTCPPKNDNHEVLVRSA
eukprot:6199375-Pleurochrysis_carterae.AAC.6